MTNPTTTNRLGMQLHPFVKSEGYRRREKMFKNGEEQRFKEQWLNKGIDEESVKKKVDDDVPAYLKTAVISFDPEKEIKKWKEGWEDPDTYEHVGGT